MNEGIVLFWDFGSRYFGFLSNVVVFGVSVLCYILGAMLVARVIYTILRLGRTVSFNKRGF